MQLRETHQMDLVPRHLRRIRRAVLVALTVVMTMGLFGACKKKNSSADLHVPVGLPANPAFTSIRVLVTTTTPRSDDSCRTDSACAEKQRFVESWFKGFTAEFRDALLSAGFRVVEAGDHDLHISLFADRITVGNDEVVKGYTTVRARVTTQKKELLAEVIFQPSVPKPDDWIKLPDLDKIYALNLFNDVLSSPRVASFAKEGGSAPEATAPAVAKERGFVTGAPQRNAFALVIGVEKYRDIDVAATGAQNDAKQFGKLAQNTLGIPEKQVHVAVGDRATRVDIEKQLDWLVANVPQDGRIYFFFSGHGAPDATAGTSFLLPFDGDPANLERTGLLLGDVLKQLRESKAAEVVAFVDTCFSGAGGRSVLPKGARPLVRMKEAPRVPQVALFTASTGAQISGPNADGKRGLFSELLTKGVGKGKADADGDGQLTLEELATWVGPRVERAAKKQNREQSPQLTVPVGMQAGDIVIAHGIATPE